MLIKKNNQFNLIIVSMHVDVGIATTSKSHFHEMIMQERPVYLFYFFKRITVIWFYFTEKSYKLIFKSFGKAGSGNSVVTIYYYVIVRVLEMHIIHSNKCKHTLNLYFTVFNARLWLYAILKTLLLKKGKLLILVVLRCSCNFLGSDKNASRMLIRPH